MLCESLMIILIESGLLPKEETLEAIASIVEVKQEIAGTKESVVVSVASIRLLQTIAQSLAAVAVLKKPIAAVAS